MKLINKNHGETLDFPQIEDWTYSYNEHRNKTVIMFGEVVLYEISGEADEDTCESIVSKDWFLEDSDDVNKINEDYCLKKLQYLADNGNSGKVEIIHFTNHCVFNTLSIVGYKEYRVHDITAEGNFDLLSQSEDLKYAHSIYIDRITSMLQINKDEFSNKEDFQNICNTRGAEVYRKGTADEYATFKVLDRAEV